MSDVARAVERALDEVHRLERTAAHFSPSSQFRLFERLNALVRELQGVQREGDRSAVHIPMQVVSYVDEGRNPDEFTRAMMTACVQRNATTKGKVEAFKALRAALLQKLDEFFPDETDAYRQIRTKSHEISRGGGKEVGTTVKKDELEKNSNGTGTHKRGRKEGGENGVEQKRSKGDGDGMKMNVGQDFEGEGEDGVVSKERGQGDEKEDVSF